MNIILDINRKIEIQHLGYKLRIVSRGEYFKGRDHMSRLFRSNNKKFFIIFMVFLLLFAFLPISFHYFLWISPFFVIRASEDRKSLYIYALLIICLAILKLTFAQLSFGMLSPLSLGFLGLPSPAALIATFVPFGLLKKLISYLFVGLCIISYLFYFSVFLQVVEN